MNLVVSIIRWVARFLGIFLFLFFVWFAIEIGAPNLDIMSNQEVKLFIANILMLIGLIVVWKFELIGSLFLLGGYIFFSIANYSFWIGPIFPIFFLIGILHLFCWFADISTLLKNNKFTVRFLFK
ncbi:MAG: hypothetical protein N4A59_15670 [Marinifilum sp.]|nr:hypothetical protein [Marinifilum sp.]